MSPQHVANTVSKAGRFIDWIVAHAPAATIDLDEMRVWGDHDWARLAELMSDDTGRPESIPQASRSAIIVGLREHQRAAADPFAGLPS